MSDLISTTEKPDKINVDLRDSPEQGSHPSEKKDFPESASATVTQPDQLPNMRSVEHQIDSRIIISANYETIGRYKTDISGVAAAITFTDGSGDGPLKIESGTGSTGRAAIWMNAGLDGTVIPLFDKSPWFSTMIKAGGFAASNVKNFYLICGQVSSDLATKTYKHFGFILKNNLGTAELYLTYANGTTQTTKQIIGLTLTGPIYLHAKLVSNRYCEFYVNGTLVYTETNLQLLPAGDADNTYNRIWESAIVSASGTTSMVIYQGPLTIGWKLG